MINQLSSIICRFFFVISLLLVLLALWEKLIRLFNWTMTFMPYLPGRLVEIAALLMIFVIAILLRDIRDELKIKK